MDRVVDLWHRMLIGAVIVLSVVAFAAAAGRAVTVMSMVRLEPADRPEWSPSDRLIVETSTRIQRLRPGSARYNEAVDQLREIADKFVAHSNAALLHMIPGMVFVLLMPLQFSRRIRARRPRVHRWSGRLLVTIGFAIGLSGLYFGVLFPTYGLTEAITIATFGSVFLFAIARAVVEIRRRNVAQHREWMIRAYAAALAIATIRIVSLPLTAILIDPKTIIITSFWIGWVTTLGAAELWIRHTRPIPIPAPRKSRQPAMATG